MMQPKSSTTQSGSRVLAALVLILMLGFPVPGAAGPPLLCHPFDIGDAASLPWGRGGQWSSTASSYDVSQLPIDTLALLTPQTPVLVRMETLRRSAVYARRDPAVAFELLTRLMARALRAEAQAEKDPLAWFDAGYLVETFKQTAYLHGRATSLERRHFEAFNGYAWILKALDQAGEEPTMEFAAALVQHQRPGDHLRRALHQIERGSLLERNVTSHFPDRARFK